MQTSLSSAFLIALMLHVVGLAVMSFGWQAWRESWPRPEPLATIPVAVTPVPEPPPLQPEASPEPVSMPDVDSVPEPVPATPPLSAPLTFPTQVQPRPKPAPVAQTQHPKLPLARERAQRPAPVQREAKASPPPGLRNEPLGSAGSGSPGASPASAMPGEATPQPVAPAEGAGVGQLFAHGDMLVAPGSGSGEGEGTGGGRARAGTGAGAGGGTGPGRGGGSGNGTGGDGGISARPIGGYQVKPRYPESARRRGIEGTVLLKMRITAQGRVEDVQVIRSAGYPDLDESAMEAVRRWRFEPARRNGAPVAEDAVLLPVVFQLQ